jgi:hypothetical protein
LRVLPERKTRARASRLAAGAVGDGSGNAGVKVAVLLGHFGAKRNLDGDVAWAQFGELRAQMFHQSLARETVADAAFIVRIGSGKSRIVFHESEYSSAEGTFRRLR